MIVVDTSVWVGFLRAEDTPATLRLTRHIEQDELVAMTDVVFAELHAGTMPSRARALIDQLVERECVLRLESLDDFQRAASCRRAARSSGRPVRSIADCLIASVCIRESLPLLHDDRDFDTLATCTELRATRE